jgi:cytochrome c oxidase subunit I
VGAFTIALSILIFIVNAVRSRRREATAGQDPWDARTLEWSIPAPPPPYNFAEIPEVHDLDDFWHRKYAEDEEGRLVPVAAGGANGQGDGHGDAHGDAHGDGHGIHMPSPSYYPVLSALGLPLIGYGLLYTPALIVIGVAVLLTGLYGWAVEPTAE